MAKSPVRLGAFATACLLGQSALVISSALVSSALVSSALVSSALVSSALVSSALVSSAFAQTVPTGAYLIVDPYNADDVSFLQNNPGVFGTASGAGGVSGLFLRVDWNKYQHVLTAGTPPTSTIVSDETTIKAVAKVIAGLNGPLTISIGLAAGAQSPTDVLGKLGIPEVVTPFQPASPTAKPVCNMVPDVWNNANGNWHQAVVNGKTVSVNHNNDFVNAYEAALSLLVSDVQSQLTGSGAKITAIKVSGINTGDVEIGIQGNDLTTLGQAGCVPSGSTSATLTAADIWLQEGYLPGPTCNAGGIKSPVQRTWDNIADYLYKKFPGDFFVMDVFNDNNFTPIGPQYCDYSPASSPQNCNPNIASVCAIQKGVTNTAPLTSQYMLQLIKDFVSDNKTPGSTPVVAVQTDGLDATRPSPSINGSSIPCEAEAALHTWVGYQSATGLAVKTAGDVSAYEAGLQNGVANGASYVELDRIEFSAYVAATAQSPGHVSSFLTSLDSSLSSNAISHAGCPTSN